MPGLHFSLMDLDGLFSFLPFGVSFLSLSAGRQSTFCKGAYVGPRVEKGVVFTREVQIGT